MITNTGKQFITYQLGSNLQKYIQYVGIGTGSQAVLATDSTLVTETNRVLITGSPNFDTTQKVTFQADYNSFQMSGIILTEFGLSDTGSTTNFTGSMWQRVGFGSIVFDGSNELQIISTLQVV